MRTVTRGRNVIPMAGAASPMALRLVDGAADANLQERVLATLRRAILAGAFEPGETLGIRPLAMQLGVSAMPVREAMGRLATEGVLEVGRNRAFRLPVLNVETFRHLCLVRLRLESLLCERAAVIVTAEELAALRVLLARLTVPAGVPAHAYLSLHHAFHFAVYAAARMPVVFDMAETLWIRLGPLMHVSNQPRDTVIDQGFHARLLAALEDGDPRRAADVLHDDIANSRSAIVGYLLEQSRKEGQSSGRPTPLFT